MFTSRQCCVWETDPISGYSGSGFRPSLRLIFSTSTRRTNQWCILEWEWCRISRGKTGELLARHQLLTVQLLLWQTNIRHIALGPIAWLSNQNNGAEYLIFRLLTVLLLDHGIMRRSGVYTVSFSFQLRDFNNIQYTTFTLY